MARSYERSEVSAWNMFAWQGFFMALQDHIENMDWDLVKPPGAPFMAAYWHYTYWGVWDTNLQIQQNLLVMKMGFWEEMDTATRKSQRDEWFGILTQASEGSKVRILRPQKWGVGKTMTAAHIGDRAEWIHKGSDGYLDLDATVDYLNQAMAVLERARATIRGHLVAGAIANAPVSHAVELSGAP